MAGVSISVSLSAVSVSWQMPAGNFTGQGGTVALESAPNEWVFAPERNVLELSNPEKILFIIATRKVRGENGEEITETLKLEVNVTKR